MKKDNSSYKVGDFAWFVPTGGKRAVKGEIVTINMETDIPYACLLEQVDGKYRTTMVSLLGDTSAEAKILHSSFVEK